MESLKSFNGYGKMDPSDDQAFRRKSKARLILLIAVTVVLVLGISVAIAVVVGGKNRGSGSSSAPPQSSSSIKAVCSATRYPDSCFSSLSSGGGSAKSDPISLFGISLTVASRAVSAAVDLLSSVKIPPSEIRIQKAVADCGELLEDALDRLNDSFAIVERKKGGRVSGGKIGDLRTWLSAAMTDHETCADGLEGGFGKEVRAALEKSAMLVSNSLAIATSILRVLERFGVGKRRLAEVRAVANVTVAIDGSGKVGKVQQAVDMAPRRSEVAFVIYVKKGVYEENVVVGKDTWNVVLVGDGMNATVITGSKNFVDGTPTFSTATVAVIGRGFVARDIGFRNSAGAAKHQAVAMQCSSDRSVFYRCSFDGFQDTLYAHSNRQFYRDCLIVGTVDFIFGNAAVVFQNCSIQPRQPLPGQANTITAQGRNDPNQNTGISVQGCAIGPYGAVSVRTYLGRPWKNYSRTMIMQSEIGPVVDPTGWMPWVPGANPPGTINYGEYQNTGAGANVTGRVRWPGYRPAIDKDEASKFTVGSFIDGPDWISEAGVLFTSNL